jgi:hypothetical protein
MKAFKIDIKETYINLDSFNFQKYNNECLILMTANWQASFI